MHQQSYFGTVGHGVNSTIEDMGSPPVLPLNRYVKVRLGSQGQQTSNEKRVQAMHKRLMDQTFNSDKNMKNKRIPSRQTLLPLNHLESLQHPPGSLQKSSVHQDCTFYEEDQIHNFVSHSPPKTSGNRDLRSLKRGSRNNNNFQIEICQSDRAHASVFRQQRNRRQRGARNAPMTSSNFSPRNQHVTTAEDSIVRGGGPSDPFEVGESYEDSLLQQNIESEQQSYQNSTHQPSQTQNLLTRLRQNPVDAGPMMSSNITSPMRARQQQPSIVREVLQHSVHRPSRDTTKHLRSSISMNAQQKTIDSYQSTAGGTIGHHPANANQSIFSICTDYNKMHKKIDQFEISLLKTVDMGTSPVKQEPWYSSKPRPNTEKLKQKSIREAREFCDMGFKRQIGYVQSLNDVIKTIPTTNKAFKDILTRISEGINDSSRHINEGLIKQQKTYQNILNDNDYILTQLQTQFDTYKDQNNLDRYFTKNMDSLKCKDIMDKIKELQKDTDWFVLNREVIDAQESADFRKALDVILSEYNLVVKAKVESFIQQTEAEQNAQDAQLSKDPPLPIHQFNQEYQMTLDGNYNSLQQQTADKADEFYNGNFRKVKRHIEVQTLTMEELEEEYENEIALLKGDMRNIHFQKESLMQELKRLAERMQIQAKDCQEAQDKMNNVRDVLIEKDSEISNQIGLYQQVKQGKSDAEQTLIRVTAELGKRAQAETEMKDAYAKLEKKFDKLQAKFSKMKDSFKQYKQSKGSDVNDSDGASSMSSMGNAPANSALDKASKSKRGRGAVGTEPSSERDDSKLVGKKGSKGAGPKGNVQSKTSNVSGKGGSNVNVAKKASMKKSETIKEDDDEAGLKTGKKKTAGGKAGKIASGPNSNADSEDEFNITPGGTKTRKKKTAPGEDYDQESVGSGDRFNNNVKKGDKSRRRNTLGGPGDEDFTEDEDGDREGGPGSQGGIRTKVHQKGGTGTGSRQDTNTTPGGTRRPGLNTSGKVDSGNVGMGVGDDSTKAGTNRKTVGFKKRKIKDGPNDSGDEYEGFESGHDTEFIGSNGESRDANSRRRKRMKTASTSTQTDIELMLLKMCEVFLEELNPVVKTLNLNTRAQQDILDKVKFMVNRIMAKAVRGLTLLGLPGASITMGPRPTGDAFTDMHEFSSGQKKPIKKSWHFDTPGSAGEAKLESIGSRGSHRQHNTAKKPSKFNAQDSKYNQDLSVYQQQQQHVVDPIQSGEQDLSTINVSSLQEAVGQLMDGANEKTGIIPQQ